MKGQKAMKLTFDKEAFTKDLETLISIKSINGNCGEKSENSPLGKGINDAIEAFLEIGKRFGFKTKNLGGYCGWIEMGEGEKMLGIIAHTDTVETGDGWTYPALSCTVTEEGYYGRGVIDDKGPALLALYVMKAIQDSGIKLDKRVRLIIGGDEESGGCKCIARYKETEELPSISFSPDADYPVVFGEKGLLRVKISGNEAAVPSDFKFEGGTVVNIVPDEARAIIDGKEYVEKGKAAHGSLPEKGENAILKLAEKIVPMIKDSAFSRLMSITTAKSMNIDIKDEITSLSINPSVIYADSQKCELSYDIRYPITADGEKVIENIKKAAEEKELSAEIYFHERPLYVPTDSHLVSTLSAIYKEHTGDDRKPMAIGGGTYAKSFENCVAFGVMFPDQPSTMHAPDEFWSHKDIAMNFDILTDAVIKL